MLKYLLYYISIIILLYAFVVYPGSQQTTMQPTKLCQSKAPSKLYFPSAKMPKTPRHAS